MLVHALLEKYDQYFNISAEPKSNSKKLNSHYCQPGSHYTFIKVTVHFKQSSFLREPNREPLALPATSVSAEINHLGELVMESRLITVSNIALAVSGGG